MEDFEQIEVPLEEVVDGKIVYNTGSNMADADPSVYGRLRSAGKHKKADEMLDERGYNILLPNGEFM